MEDNTLKNLIIDKLKVKCEGVILNNILNKDLMDLGKKILNGIVKESTFILNFIEIIRKISMQGTTVHNILGL